VFASACPIVVRLRRYGLHGCTPPSNANLRLCLGLTALMAAFVTAAGPVSGIEAATSPPTAVPETSRCRTLRADLHAVIRLWIRATVEGKPCSCQLLAPGYNSREPFFGAYSMAFAQPLKPQPGHHLCLVFLVGDTRIGRYVLDLCPDPHQLWLVDLWAEL
jgi:hypothetical protein